MNKIFPLLLSVFFTFTLAGCAFDIVHIEDISRAFLAVLHAPMVNVHNEVFNVGQTEENYRIRDIAEIVKNTVPGCKIEFAKDAGPDKRNYRVNCGKIKQALPAFKPQWSARKGADELYHAFEKANLSPADFEGPRFKRIDHIKDLLRKGLLDDSLRWTRLAQRDFVPDSTFENVGG